MHLRTAPTAVVLGGLLLVGGAGTASASVCDAYSGQCTTPPSASPSPSSPAPTTSVIPTVNDRAPGGGAEDSGSTDSTTRSDAATLPFTGGELVMLSAVAAGALAAGTALVVAGRRRKSDTPA